MNRVSVIFSQRAGITNPTEAGKWYAYVKTNKNDAGPETSSGTKGLTKSDNFLETLRTLSLNAKSGKRGSTVTVKGAGFKNSTTATVWLDNGDVAGTKESNEPVLCDAPVESNDTFTCTFDANKPPLANSNSINAVDGRFGGASEAASYSLDPQIRVNPSTAAIGDTVTIELIDFNEAKLDNLTSDGFDLGGAPIRLAPTANQIRNEKKVVCIPSRSTRTKTVMLREPPR